MALKQSDADFFRPLWRRILVTVLVTGWFAFEIVYSRDQLWIVVTGAALAYCLWTFFIRFPKEPPAGSSPGGPSAAP
jgi:hypothetical protein